MTPIRSAALVVCLLLALPLLAAADEQGGGGALDLQALREERNAKIAKYGVRSRTADRIAAAVDLLEANEYAAAREKLERMSFKRMNPYEEAVVHRLVAYAAVGQEDFEAAIRSFQSAVDTAALALDDEIAVRYNIAQLSAAAQEWHGVTEALAGWFPLVEEPNPAAYYLLAIAYYQLGELANAFEPAKQAVELSLAPREGWLQLLAALYVGNDDYAGAIPILERLVARYPKKQYWVQLSLIYGATNRYEEALAVQQLAHAQQLLTEDAELRRLARTYLYHELPHPAAVVLEQGLAEQRIDENVEALELLANCWIAAREYESSLAPLERAAALSVNGELYVRMGRVHIQREEWREAAVHLSRGLEKGGLDDPGAAQLLLGVSLYSDSRPDAAIPWFERASRHESSRTEANAWLEHIARERRASEDSGSS
jgi:tetratricopeptide (TPR) repeat protein